MNLEQSLNELERRARGSKWKRFLYQPWQYAEAMWFKEVVYPRTKMGRVRTARTFFGQPMQVLLPAATDILVTGGKAHDSEIRLTRWLVQQLKLGMVFTDVGAHYGYFTLLAAQLVGINGRVFSFEAAPRTFRILQQNTRQQPQVEIFHRAVSDTAGNLVFYEFPALHSEYNTLKIEQFKDLDWYEHNRPQEIEVSAVRLDDFFATKDRLPDVIKIDAEGAEFQIVQGLSGLLNRCNPIIILEYQQSSEETSVYKQTVRWLKQLQFESFVIHKTGNIERCDNIAAWLHEQNLDSDNIILKKLT